MKSALLSILLYAGITGTLFAWNLPLDVDLVDVTSSSSYTVLVSYGEIPDQLSERHFAYLTSQGSPTVQASFTTTESGISCLTVGTEYYCGNDSWDLNNNRFGMSEEGSADDVSFSTNYSLPSSIYQNTVGWYWYVYAVNDTTLASPVHIGTSVHDYFTLLNAPKPPFYNNQVWREVLWKSCSWASGETSESSVLTDITNTLYSSGFQYNTETLPVYYSEPYFLLEDFIVDYGEDEKNVNCVDMACAVDIFASALGCYVSCDQMTWSRVKFPVNVIDLIGDTTEVTNNPLLSTPIDNNCRTGGFILHVYAINNSNYVWDATLKYDTDANPNNVIPDGGCGTTTGGTVLVLPTNVSRTTFSTNLTDEEKASYDSQSFSTYPLSYSSFGYQLYVE